MAVERAGDTDTDVETVQEERATDHRPPPDNPGAEGVPSRADSRAGAANDIGERPQASRPETAEQQETSGEQDSATDEDGPDTSAPSHATVETTDAAEEQRADARPALRDPPESEPEAPSRADSRAAAAAANTEQVSTSKTEIADASPGQTEGSAREISGASRESSPITKDDPRTKPAPANEVSEITSPATAPEAGQQTTGDPLAETGNHPPDDATHVAAEGGPFLDPAAATEKTSGSNEGAGDTNDLGIATTDDPGSPADSAMPHENEPDGEDSTEKRPLGDRLTVDGRPLREHLDPAGAAAWSNASVEAEPEPTGDRVADAEAPDESPETSRLEKFRRKLTELREDALDAVQKDTDTVNNLLTRQPPTGHTETSSAPEVLRAPHDASVGDMATALLSTGIVISETVRWCHGKLTETKERQP